MRPRSLDMSASRASLELLPVELLRIIANYLTAEDIARLSQTCRRLNAAMPKFQVFRGVKCLLIGDEDPGYRTSCDGPPLTSSVQRMKISITWKDGLKGEIFVVLIRDGSREIAVESLQLKRFKPYRYEKDPSTAGRWSRVPVDPLQVFEFTNRPLVTEAKPGDFYSLFSVMCFTPEFSFKTIVQYY